ncbi:MAG TPA: PQQ-binding-like beta-propeller repeat protein [Alphaproteobacteria bacterium]|nr:PQQ-binding-like beta-propeller repeat protein [Alphaproteobacteria bacterium]
MHSRLVSSLVIPALALGACDWFGGPDKTPLAGERIAVIAQSQSVEADRRLADVPVRLPEPVANNAWAQAGGTPTHAMQHLAAEGFTIAWRADVGSGVSRDGRITAAPVVAAGKIFAVDAGVQVSAFDAAGGGTLWRFDVRPSGDGSGGAGGGVAYDNGRLYVGSGFAQVIALDADTGSEIWRTTLTAPVRGAPTVGGGRVFAITADNQTHSLDADSGRKLWSHAGISESAGIYGGSSPALFQNAVIAAYSSGELFALRADNGRVLWAESLAGALRADAVSSLADIRGFPVIDRGVVYAASHSGRVAAIDLRSGGRIWEQDFGSLYTPWIAGDFMFVTTVENEVVAVTRRDGRVRWVQKLAVWRDATRKRGRIVWTGPVLVAGRLFLASSEGEALAISAASGAIESRFSIAGSVTAAPIVANGTIYVLTDSATLIALR